MERMDRQEEKTHRKTAFLTLGCKVNSYETNAMERLFREAGYEIVDFQDEADIYIINTCTVTNIADRKSRQMLHRARKKNPDALVAAAGCYVQAAGEQLKLDEAVDVIIGNNQKHNAVEIVEAYLEQNGAGGQNTLSTLPDISKETGYESLYIEAAGEKTRAYIKIQDGCNQFCSYCIIPYARGRVRSRSMEDIVSEVRVLAQNGYKEIVLTGIHLSSYGVDMEPWKGKCGSFDFAALKGQPLLEVIKQISGISGLERIRLGSLEPRIITEEFAAGLSEYPKVCPHFHLSLQSGCDDTLKRMNRRYNTKEYLEGCRILRKFFRDPAITTDIIVGFPGETEEEFNKTMEFVRKVSFADIHVFKFSPRKGTKAWDMDNTVPDQVKNERSEKLIGLTESLSREYRTAFRDTIQKVLFEEEVTYEGHAYHTGHNERYVKLALEVKEGNGSYSNRILTVRVGSELKNGMLLCYEM